MLSSQFVQLFQYKPEDVAVAEKKFLFWLLLPGFLIISFILGYQLFSWIGAFTALLVGLGIGYLAVEAVVVFGSPASPQMARREE